MKQWAENGGTSADWGLTPKQFDWVVLRHGPVPAIAEFRTLFNKCKPLIDQWEAINPLEDPTRRRRWSPEDYPDTHLSSPEVRQVEEDARAAAQGNTDTSPVIVFAQEMKIWKLVRNDGSCTIRYGINGLAVTQGKINGIQFFAESAAGWVGDPTIQDSEQLGVTWAGERNVTQPAEMPEIVERVRRLSGVFSLSDAVSEGKQPLNLVFELSITNGHARTAWEFDQIYRAGQRHGLDNSVLDSAERFERIVWFPVAALTISITLPAHLRPRVVAYMSRSKPRFVQNRTLLLDPPDPNVQWEALSDGEISKKAKLERVGEPNDDEGQEWRLRVQSPALGSCWALEWQLPKTAASALVHGRIRLAQSYRSELLDHARERRESRQGNGLIREAFKRVISSMHRFRILEESENFRVHITTYDEEIRSIVVVDGAQDGLLLSCVPDPGRFSLPYGLGLSGACFKEANNAFVFDLSRREPGKPQLYLPLLQRNYEVLLAFPLLLPVDDQSGPNGDAARECLGVLNVGSGRQDTKLAKALGSSGIEEISGVCHQFVRDIKDIVTK